MPASSSGVRPTGLPSGLGGPSMRLGRRQVLGFLVVSGCLVPGFLTGCGFKAGTGQSTTSGSGGMDVRRQRRPGREQGDRRPRRDGRNGRRRDGRAGGYRQRWGRRHRRRRRTAQLRPDERLGDAAAARHPDRSGPVAVDDRRFERQALRRAGPRTETACAAPASKWAQTIAAINQVVGQTQNKVNWGLMFLGDEVDQCGAATAPVVDITPGNSSQLIQAALNGVQFTGTLGTPTTAVMNNAVKYLQGLTDAESEVPPPRHRRRAQLRRRKPQHGRRHRRGERGGRRLHRRVPDLRRGDRDDHRRQREPARSTRWR